MRTNREQKVNGTCACHERAYFNRAMKVRVADPQPMAAVCALFPGHTPMTDWYLVWIEGPRGPEPQKWSSEGLWGQLGRQDVIVRFPLTDREAKLSLDRLAKAHPIPLK